MIYCKRCTYPTNARPSIYIDEEGICSGCRVHEQRQEIDWAERELWLRETLEKAKAIAKQSGNPYDCIIPVSGGKDSHFQVHIIKEIYGLQPLCVTYNHTYNTHLGIRNLTNLIEKFNVPLIRFTTAPQTALTISRYMLKKIGDITWHYHAGIMTFPIQIAVAYQIPLIIWGEEGFSELVGMFDADQMIEYSRKKALEHDMRNLDPQELLQDPSCPLTRHDLAPFVYPSDQEIEDLNMHGVYLSNYINWNPYTQTEQMINQYGFEPAAPPRDRTWDLYSKIDDIHANGVHDYLKYLKFGYGRATDDCSLAIRHNRLNREEACHLVHQFDHIRPRDLNILLRALNLTEPEFEAQINHLRDPQIWAKNFDGTYAPLDSVYNHRYEGEATTCATGNINQIKGTSDAAKASQHQTQYRIL